MKTLKLWIAKLFCHHYGNMKEVEQGEPFILIRGTDPDAPVMAEILAKFKLRADGNYHDYRRLNELAQTIREWQAKNTNQVPAPVK